MVDLREALHNAAPPASELVLDRLEHRVRRRRQRRRALVGSGALAIVVLGVGLSENLGRGSTTIQTTAPRPSPGAGTSPATITTTPTLAPCSTPLAARDFPVGWSHEFAPGSGGEPADVKALGHWSGGRGHYVDVFGPDNGWVKLPLAADLHEGEPIQVLGSQGQIGGIHEGYAVAVVLPGPPQCGLLFAGYGMSKQQLRALAESIYDPDVTTSEAPSQSVSDAARDGVLPEVAALALDRRSQREASVTTPEGRWVLSRAPAPFVDGGALGDTAGTYGIDFVAMTEYGEMLLVDDAGMILKAYPMPGVPPKWMQVTDDAVYGGAVGDGALPDSTIFRIDRTTRTIQLIHFGHPDSTDRRLPRPWREATTQETTQYGDIVQIGPDGPGTAAVSTIGPVVFVNLERLEQLFR